MTISDSIPIQFWLNGVETFNQKVICGLSKQECFCQPFECDDEITIQFQDDNYAGYQLNVYSASDTLLATTEFEEITDGVWQVSFRPSELSPSICEVVKFTIDAYEPFANASFDDGLADWSEVELGSDGDWTADDYLGDNAARWVSQQITYGSNGSKTENTDYLRHDFIQLVPAVRTVSYSFRVGDFANLGLSITNIEFRVRYRKDGYATAEEVVLTGLTENSSHSGTFNTAESDFDQIEFYFRATLNVTSFGSSNVEPSYYMLEFDIPSDELLNLATSDCINLKESHDCTELISYTNSTDFDDIVYEGVGSPAPTFYLRIPAMFHQEENPQTQEDSELSNGVIITRRQTIQEKTLLETGYIPNYMHKKLQKVLMHETITLQDTQWKRRDAYEANPINKYNLKRASVLLTKYNSVERNTI